METFILAALLILLLILSLRTASVKKPPVPDTAEKGTSGAQGTAAISALFQERGL